MHSFSSAAVAAITSGGACRVAQMEVRLLLATILQRYRPSLVSLQDIVPLPRVTLRPRNGMRMLLEAQGVPV